MHIPTVPAFPAIQRFKAALHRINPDEVVRGIFRVIGGLVGGLGGLVAFVAVYLAAIESAGWVVGIALGWIPAFLVAAIVYFLGRYLWWTLPFLIHYVRHAFF
jgi:hypothetical protein